MSELAEANQQLRHEIDERQRAEAELRRAFAMLDQHVNNTPLSVIEWEQDHAAGEPPRVHRWSGRAQTIFGWTEDEVLGRSAEEIGFVYRAKHHGRGQYRFYSRDMDVELKETRSVEDGLRRALEQGTLELVYQPIFAFEDGCVRGVEALIRWRHPGGGSVSPSSFIPGAEMSGLIVPLGEWILRQTCRQAWAWMKAGRRLRVAVNLSAVQLRQPDFAVLVERALADSGLASSALEFEVTESVFLDPSN